MKFLKEKGFNLKKKKKMLYCYKIKIYSISLILCYHLQVSFFLNVAVWGQEASQSL